MKLKPQPIQLDVWKVCTYYLDDHAPSLPTDVLMQLRGWIRSRSYEKLAEATSLVDTLSSSVNTVRVLRQVSAFFKKNADFAVDDVCQKAALKAFDRGERLCRITNRRLDHFYNHQDRMDPVLLKWIERAQAFILKVLGPYDKFEESIPSLLRLTSGASAKAPRSSSLPPMKFRGAISCTPQCAPLVSAAFRFCGYPEPKLDITPWNRVEFVQKSWKTHRSICCEPAANVPFQLAVDTWVKRRFRRLTRIDLSTQENNKEQARIGSIDGSLATVDLSMASDTVSMNTIYWLIPEDWCRYLFRTRSPFYNMNGIVHKYAKFSSMGNGATFAIETLLFASFIYAVGSKKGLAYGDDLTIETELYPDLIKLLRFFGFVPNEDKSFHEGPFRESCGGDFFNGIDVTPFYIRKTDAWDKPNTCHNVNGLARVSSHGKLWDYLATFIEEARLPLVAVCDDTQAGVHIHPHHAYAQRLLRYQKTGKRQGHHLHQIFVRKTKNVRFRNERALVLWYLTKFSKNNGFIPPTTPVSPLTYLNHVEEQPFESSLYSTSVSERFERKWVTWHPPCAQLPDPDLFGFSELLTRE